MAKRRMTLDGPGPDWWSLGLFVASAGWLAVNGWALLYLRQPNLPIGVAFGLVTFCAGLTTMVYALWRLLRSSRSAFKQGVTQVSRLTVDRSGRRSAAQSQAWAASSRSWLAARLADRPTGWRLSVGLLFAGVLGVIFISVAKDVWLRDEIVDIDRVVVQTVYGLRTPDQTVFFELVTFMGGVEAMAAMLLLIAVLGWRQQVLPVIFGLAIVAALAVTQLLKVVFGRLRPDEAWRLVAENGFSFPSGHSFAATVMYGLAGYVLWRLAKTVLARLLALAGALSVIVLVAASRVYLGVHYPSDVLASVCLGLAIVDLLVVFVETNRRFSLWPRWQLRPEAGPIVLAAFGGTVVAALVWTVIHQ